MRRRWGLALAAAALMVVGATSAALATGPISLDENRFVDQSDVLDTGAEQTVQDRLIALSDDTDVDLWVVYVDDFSDPADPAEWANQTASINGLGPNQYLLAIATEGRQYYLSGDSSGPVSEDQLATIEQNRIQPQLTSGDWAGGAIAAADGLQDAVAGGIGGSGGSALLILLGILVVGGIIVAIVLIRRRRARAGTAGATAAPAEPLDQLARRAASALVQTDDAIKTSEQELGFASAQFGESATAEFATVLAHAKESLDTAFALQQQLDDGIEDTEAQQREWNTEILRLCETASDELDAKAAAFDELRQLEQNAPEALARVQELRTTVLTGVRRAQARLTNLQGSYAPEALATVADNPSQATSRLEFADTQLTSAQQALAAGDGAAAAVGIRAAEEAVDQARLLEEAVDSLGDDLAAGEQSAVALIADLEKDLATAGALPDPSGTLAPIVAATAQQVNVARQNLSGAAKRPLVTLQALERVNTEIDAAIAGVRTAQQQAERARQVLDQTLMQVGAQVSAAENFITSRRGAVGATARTRLAEAGSTLVQARSLSQSDPTQALSLAQRAGQLAEQATQHAQADVGAFSGGGMFGGGQQQGGGNMMGAILGGIVINSLLGGGSRGGGGGGMFGGGGSSSSRGGGGFSPGSFGGGGTRSRRGGGRF
ncbi:TPM domain-containing protein [Microbacterium sp.]|uniref:TPM domain-containing protein n=1 Tax=Microbacterium sp. TaxID=51671 RepID=UPI003A8BF3EA